MPTLQYHLRLHASTHPEVVEQLTKSLYVDNVIFGARDQERAYQLYQGSKGILKKGGFNLRKFQTNVDQLQQKINKDEGVPEVSSDSASVRGTDETYAKSPLGSVQAVHPGEQKVLGVRWSTSTDQLRFNFDELAQLATKLEPTKQNVVSVIGRFYDPLGFIAPVVVKFKMLFQTLCDEKQDWDQLLTGDLLQRWSTLVAELQLGPTMSLPRCFLDGVSGEGNSFSLHGFCDASKHAYAAVVYLAIETPTVHLTKFVTSKTRIVSLKSQTIPRLELLSTLLLARLIHSTTASLESELTLDKPTCYTDSKVALFWILGMSKTWKQFVQHRVSEIRKLMPTDCWRHCPGAENPADLPSRGVNPVELSCSDIWAYGPEWLGKSTSEIQIQDMPMPSECSMEMRSKDKPRSLSLFVSSESPSLGQVLKCESYGSLQKLLMITSHVLRFIENLKKRRISTKGSRPPDAEVLWIKEAQRSLTSDDQLKNTREAVQPLSR